MAAASSPDSSLVPPIVCGKIYRLIELTTLTRLARHIDNRRQEPSVTLGISKCLRPLSVLNMNGLRREHAEDPSLITILKGMPKSPQLRLEAEDTKNLIVEIYNTTASPDERLRALSAQPDRLSMCHSSASVKAMSKKGFESNIPTQRNFISIS
ncbi:hypothetical protein Hypma_004547 [Hypsizygus marmoreus]|uniref:Uncharacterized protein n=1 Tax=Hypsizygus marmoreus TaxID=39966 RepID=A0A369J967_HYPMA|nr:hypothetical protein Hypma_004547 [Hypsizygus marmoreus]